MAHEIRAWLAAMAMISKLGRWSVVAGAVLIACGGSVSGGGGVDDAGAAGGGGGFGGFPTGGAGGTTAGAGGSTGGNAGDGGGCVVPKLGAIDGDYIFSLAVVLDDSKPIMFLTNVTTEDVGGSAGMRWHLQGLQWNDRKTLVGGAFDLPALGDPAYPFGADGTFDAKLPPLTVVGLANPFSHTDITAEVSLKGKLCNSAGFFCGTASGNVTKPIPVALDGSTWTLEKVESGVYPEPPHVNCQKKLGAPVGSWQ